MPLRDEKTGKLVKLKSGKQKMVVDPSSGWVDVTTPSRISKTETLKLDKRIDHIYDHVAYANDPQSQWFLKTSLKKTMKEAGQDFILLGLDNWGPQATERFKEEAERMNINLVYTPGNCTDLCAVIDRGVGKKVKDIMVGSYKKDLRENLDKWKRNEFSASDFRIKYSKWFGDACDEFTRMCRSGEYDVVKYFQQCGMANCSNGCEYSKVSLPGPDHKDYVPPWPWTPKIKPTPFKKLRRKKKPDKVDKAKVKRLVPFKKAADKNPKKKKNIVRAK